MLRARDTVIVTIDGEGDEPSEEVAAELVPRVLHELSRPVTIVTEPLVGSVGPLGVLSLAFIAQPEPSEPELRFLSTLAGLTAQALERAQLFEHEREALLAAEAGRERLSLLSEVTRLLSSSLEPTTVIRRTMSLVEGRLADSCIVLVPGDNGLLRLDVDEPGTAPLQPVASGKPKESVPFGSDAPAAVAYRTGRTQLAPLAGGGYRGDGEPFHGTGRPVDRERRGHRRDDVHRRPEPALRGRRRVPGHRGGQPDRGRALERNTFPARARRRRGAPASRPTRLAARRRRPRARRRVPGWRGRHLRRRRLVRRVRDRRGLRLLQRGRRHGQGCRGGSAHGPGAKCHPGLRGVGQSPTEVLASLDRLFDALIDDRVVTAVVGTITPSTGRVVLSNAGHPPPLVVRGDGSATFCPDATLASIAAGLSGAPRPRDELVLDRGDSLIMYSDGLIERRGELITDGMERLANTATVIARAGWPDLRPRRFVMLSAEERTDDVVVLCLSYTGLTAERINDQPVGTTRDGMSTLHLEPVVESTPVARHWIAAT